MSKICIICQNLSQFEAIKNICHKIYHNTTRVWENQCNQHRQTVTFLVCCFYTFVVLHYKGVSISSRCTFTYDPCFCFFFKHFLVNNLQHLKNICHKIYCSTKNFAKNCHETSQSVNKILPPKIQLWQQNKNNMIAIQSC